MTRYHQILQRFQELRWFGRGDHLWKTHIAFNRSSSAFAHVLAVLALVLGSALFPTPAAAADIYDFSLLPAGGVIFGNPGSLIGWGYSITNESTSDWLLATNLAADSFAFGAPTLLFDFPEVAPTSTVSEVFDPIGGTGLYEDLLGISAPPTSIDSGNFILSAQWYDGDPFNGGNVIADAIDSSVPYTATVNSSSATPEPISSLLVAIVLASMVVFRKRRGRPSAAASPSSSECNYASLE